jgi:hypothetical protein
MPSLSQQQQKLMGLALAYKRGDVPDSKVSGKIKKLASAMTTSDLEKYASTKHKGLPKKVENKVSVEELRNMIADAIDEVMQEKITTSNLNSEQKNLYIEAISNYNKYRSIIHRSKELPTAVSEIKNLVEFATKNIVAESGDWFEGVSIKRKTKKLKEAMYEFEKTSQKVTKLQKTLESIYEHIGRQLSNFYEIK